MAKPREKFYRIGEVAESSDVPKTTLNHYLAIGLIHPVKKSNGYRLFSEDVFDELEQIARLKKAGKSLAEIKAIMNRS